LSKTLAEVLTEQDIELSPSGNGRWVAVCPFHEGDRDPSFTVYPHNDTYYCFGCSAWGDAVKFLCDYKGWTTTEAQAYVGVDHELRRSEKSRVIKTRDVLRTWEFLDKVATLYHGNLLGTAGATNYLKRRGLTDDTIRVFRLGYTDGRVLSIDLAGDFSLAQECGLINSNGYETLAHRITIPNYCGVGRCDFIMGRTVTNDRIKYLGLRMPKPMYGFTANAKSPILFMAEGQFDWLILQQWGYPSIVMSGSHLPRYHLMSLRDKIVIIIPDNDATGQETAKKVHASLTNSYILDYSSLGVKDIGELGAIDGGEQQFSKLLEEQEWFKNIRLSKARWMKWLPPSLNQIL
jgi:DNA primase